MIYAQVKNYLVV